MNKEQFKEEFEAISSKYGLVLKDKQISCLYEYMMNLIEWNSKINLTAINNEDDIIVKHFIDSIYIEKYIKGKRGVDIGSGAGFPGIPLKIINDNYSLLLVDSVNKKVNFMNDSIEKLNLNNIEVIHNRAEEIGQDKKYREQFDFAVSRAVANMTTLVEYLIPLVKCGGKIYCLKGPNVEDELLAAQNAIKILGGKIEEKITYNIEENERCLVIISKEKNTEQTYPRKMGKPLKEPLR